MLARPAVNEVVREYVKTYILSKGLVAGDPLPSEAQIAQELGVARGSVREAIKSLQSLGIIEVRQGYGLFVSPYNFEPLIETVRYGMRFDVTTLLELAQVRSFLEYAAIEQAMERINPQDIEQLETLLQTWQHKNTAHEGDAEIDEEFHRILYSSLNNQTLMKFLELFWIAFDSLGDDPYIHGPKPPNEDYLDHRAILDSVKAGDRQMAQQLLLKHFAHLQERIQRSLGTTAVPPNTGVSGPGGR